MKGAPCHAHRHRHMMHALFEAWHGLNALTTAPKHPPRRPGGRAAIMRQPLDPEQSSIHGRRNLGGSSAGPEAGLCRSTAGWCWAARTHACACIGLSRRRQSWRLLECCGSVDRCVQQLSPPSLRPGSELDCGMAIAHMLAHNMWPKQARRRVHSQAWFTQKCALLHTRLNRNREVMHG